MRRTLTTMVTLAACGLLAGGCLVKKRRAALVPHMVPSPRSGQPIYDGAGQLYMHYSAVSHLQNPREAPDANAGVYIPRHQIGAGARLRLAQNWDMGFIMEYGLRHGAFKVASDVPPGPDMDTIGAGLSFGYSIRATRRFRIGLAFDTLLYFIPKVEYIADAGCTEAGGWDCTVTDRGTEVEPVFSLSVIPSFRALPWLTIFAGITLRNHPTIQKEGWDSVITTDDATCWNSLFRGSIRR